MPKYRLLSWRPGTAVPQVHAGFGQAWLSDGFNQKVVAKLEEIDAARQAEAPLRFWITGSAAAAAFWRTAVAELDCSFSRPVRNSAAALHLAGGIINA
jgi:hypothetical protein